jgi:hypothetical protein
MQARYEYITVHISGLEEWGGKGFKAVSFLSDNRVVMERVVTQTGQLLGFLSDLEQVKSDVEALRTERDDLKTEHATLRTELRNLATRFNNVSGDLISIQERVNYLKTVMEVDEAFDWDTWVTTVVSPQNGHQQ